ncbi:MAG: leucine-rich repeat domain-containing protein [Paludibacteraceae bacterium]|nr:leucine-rich repeat domain-containing protein [Paludibacteraceae bacterium]
MMKKITLLLLYFVAMSLSAQQQTFTMTTEQPAGAAFRFVLNYGAMVEVDWGDGVPVQITVTSEALTAPLKGSTVVVSGYDITALDCADAGLTALNVTELTNLTSLNCHSNALTTLDVTKNRQLRTLNCAYNKLTVINLTGLSLLEELVLNDNSLKSLALTAARQLQYLDCRNNQIGSLSLSLNTKLRHLWCANNALLSLDVSKCTMLNSLVASGNTLVTLKVDGLGALTDIWCDNNLLSALSLSANEQLTYLSANHNAITQLSMPARAAYDALYLHDNKLGYSALVSPAQSAAYQYAPQQSFVLPANMEVGKAVDLSAYLTTANAVSTNAQFEWFSGDAKLTEGVDYTVQSAVFTFLKAQNPVRCEISSSLFSELPRIVSDNAQVAGPSSVGLHTENEKLIVSAQHGLLSISAVIPQTLVVRSATGSVLKQIHNFQGRLTLQLPQGVYLVNQRKVVI